MNNKEDQKRVFFAFKVHAPWPEHLPRGRILIETERHMTLVFIGNTAYSPLEKILPLFPPPPIKMGLVGKFDKCIFLPPKRVNVAAWHVKWFDQEDALDIYQKQVIDWLQAHHIPAISGDHGFLPHVTICRRPFRFDEWREAFHPLPMYIQEIHLFESLGNLRYQSLWSFPLRAPFEEVSENEWLIRGESLSQLFKHAVCALSFRYPKLLSCIENFPEIGSEEELKEILNDLILRFNRREEASLQVASDYQIKEEAPGILNFRISNPKRD